MKYKVGDKVRIVSNRCGHEFCMGDIVDITIVAGSYYNACKDGISWAITDEEVEPVGTETEEKRK